MQVCILQLMFTCLESLCLKIYKLLKQPFIINFILCAENPALKKIYRPTYVWGQLSGWFKQTVNDPTASLSAERRGALSLPDIESCFGDPARYGLKVSTERYRVEVECVCWFQCRLYV